MRHGCLHERMPIPRSAAAAHLTTHASWVPACLHACLAPGLQQLRALRPQGLLHMEIGGPGNISNKGLAALATVQGLATLVVQVGVHVMC